jgi:hypothetical protein
MFVSRRFSRLAKQDGDLKDNLMKFKIDEPEVNQYLETDSGKSQVEKLLKFIKSIQNSEE